MKIIKTDNFCREHIADSLIAENCDQYYGLIIVHHLNEKWGNSSPHYFRLVENDYKLNIGMEDLV